MTIGQHADGDHNPFYARVDFLSDLTGPSGNVFAIFGAIKSLGRQFDDRDLFDRFKSTLDQRRQEGDIVGDYDDVLDQIVLWFGPQSAINDYRGKDEL